MQSTNDDNNSSNYQFMASPWVLYRVDGVKNIPVGRFRRRVDCMEQQRLLRIYVPSVKYEIAYSPRG